MKTRHCLFVLQLLLTHINTEEISTEKLNCVVQLSKYLAINNLIIINSYADKTNINQVDLLKHFSQFYLQTYFLSLEESNSSLQDLSFMSSITIPRILVWIIKEKSTDILRSILTTSREPLISKFIWVIFDGNDFSHTYIPYDCEFFNIKTANESYFKISEVYSKTISTQEVSEREIGIYERNRQKFYISNADFYARRFDMNNTSITVEIGYYQVSKKRKRRKIGFKSIKR